MGVLLAVELATVVEHAPRQHTVTVIHKNI